MMRLKMYDFRASGQRQTDKMRNKSTFFILFYYLGSDFSIMSSVTNYKLCSLVSGCLILKGARHCAMAIPFAINTSGLDLRARTKCHGKNVRWANNNFI